MPDADVVIVGFRCAGAPLACALARAGAKVVVVEKDAFFTDQPISTHAIQPFGMKVLDRLGLGDRVRALAPPNRAFRLQVEEHALQVELDGTERDSRSPRRSKLDPALQEAALEAGVDAREKTRVVGLLGDGRRVTGVRVKNGTGESEIRAPLVVGADGRHSTLARLVAAPAYLETESPNAIYWSYFEQTPVFREDPRYDWGACIHIEGEEARAVFQTDSNLLLLAGGGRRERLAHWGENPEAALLEHLRRGRLTAPLLEGARMVTPPVGQRLLRFFMKPAVGPGWALVGDAGLHLDPTPGLGITDAVRDAALLAEAILEGSEAALLRFWRRRDADSIGLYHFAADMGSSDYNNPFTRMVFERAGKDPVMSRRLEGMMDRTIRPQDMVPPGRLLRWLAAETFRGNLAPWSALGRTLRLGRLIDRDQRVLDRALRRAEAGDPDASVPALSSPPVPAPAAALPDGAT